METQLLEQIRSDSESSFKKGASERQIALIQKRLAVTFPPSYREFLREFNGGEFRFARMFRISAGGGGFLDLEEDIANLAKHFPAFRARELLAFGDDYSGNHYCFELTKVNREGECRVVYWDRLMGKTGPDSHSPNFGQFLRKGLKGSK